MKLAKKYLCKFQNNALIPNFRKKKFELLGKKRISRTVCMACCQMYEILHQDRKSHDDFLYRADVCLVH